MAELMGERHHVARLALVVHQHVGMRRRRGRMRERARRLAGPHRRIDPAVGEEALGDVGHARREAAIGRQHHVLRLGPGDAAGRGERQRRVAVPMRQLLLFEPAGLQPVIAMRQFRIGRAHRGDQRIDDLALDAVVEMAGVRDIGKAAPAVGNVLVLGERVGDQRKGALIGLEGLCQRLRGRLALLAVAILQEIERRLDRQLLARHLEAQRGDGLVEQPVPGGITGLGFFVEQLLDAVLELIRLVLAQVLDPRPVMPEFRRLHRMLDHAIVNAVELEREEQQMRRGRRQPLGDVAVKFRDRGIDAVAGMHETGIGTKSPCEIVDRFIASHGFREPLSAIFPCAMFRQLALVVRLKRDAIGIHLREVALLFPARRCRHRDRPGSTPAVCRPCSSVHIGLVSYSSLFILGLFILDLAADLLMFDLRRADVEREVILFRTCVQPERTEKFKSALIGIGESAPIRDR